MSMQNYQSHESDHIVRRVPVDERESVRELDQLKITVASAIRETTGWKDRIAFTDPNMTFDRPKFFDRFREISELTGTASAQTYDLHLNLGMQFLTPKYDRWWATGSGMPWADLDGSMFVVGSDGFSASGFGMYLEADEPGLLSIVPQGLCQANWVSLDDLPSLHSMAGAGVVAYDGATILVSRQPLLWDVRSPGKYMGNGYNLPFGNIATPAIPDSFGTVPLAPVLVPIEPGKRVLVWFYTWHLGGGMKDTPFIALLNSKVPLVSVVFGKSPIIR